MIYSTCWCTFPITNPYYSWLHSWSCDIRRHAVASCLMRSECQNTCLPSLLSHLPTAMAKCRIIYDNNNSSPPPAVIKNCEVQPSKHLQVVLDSVWWSLLMSNSDQKTKMSIARCPVCSGRGTGGWLAQMQVLEQIQTECSAWPSRMDLTTQREDINPMAPSSQDQGSSGNLRSRSNMIATITPSEGHEPSASFIPSQPVFFRAAPDQQFSFKVLDSNPPSLT